MAEIGARSFADSLSSSSFTADVTTTLLRGSHALPAAPLSHHISVQPLEAWLNAHAVPCAAASAGMILGGDDGVARVVLRRGAAIFRASSASMLPVDEDSSSRAAHSLLPRHLRQRRERRSGQQLADGAARASLQFCWH